MTARHDFICGCGHIERDVRIHSLYDVLIHVPCGAEMEILWNSDRTRTPTCLVHPRERAVVWVHPTTNEVRYPGRNDVPMPERYRSQGYERREFTSLRSLDRFCSHHGVGNEKAHYDRNGRGFDE